MAQWWICKGFGIDKIQVKFTSHKIIQWSIVHVEKCRDTQTSSNTVIAFLIIWLSFLGHWSKLQKTVYNGGVRETYNKYIVL
jgi:hypothetical protein